MSIRQSSKGFGPDDRGAWQAIDVRHRPIPAIPALTGNVRFRLEEEMVFGADAEVQLDTDQ